MTCRNATPAEQERFGQPLRQMYQQLQFRAPKRPMRKGQHRAFRWCMALNKRMGVEYPK